MKIFIYSVSAGLPELFCSHMDVRLLWIGSYGTTHAEVSMVEEISHETTTGKIFEHYILHAFIYNQSTVEKKPI